MSNNYSSRTQRALVDFFRMKQASSTLFRLSHGAQFSNPGGPYGFIVLLFLIVIAIVMFFQGSYVIGLVLLPICAFVVGFVMDTQGIEVDTQNGKVRNYRSFLGIRSGDWQDLNLFNQLHICQDSILEKRTMSGGSTYSSSRKYDQHNFYTLYLTDAKEKHFIKLREEESVARIKMIASKFSELTKLRLNSSIKKRQPDVVGKWRMF
ncbi:MAG: hypothetical protein AB8B56_19960 [Crocinitomicaceae bacterium]